LKSANADCFTEIHHFSVSWRNVAAQAGSRGSRGIIRSLSGLRLPLSIGCLAGGFAGRAGAANDEFALEPDLVGLIGGLLLLPLVLRMNLAVSFGRRSLERAEDDFSLRPRRLVWLKLNRLRVTGRGRAKSVPRGRRSRRRCTTSSRRTATRKHQRGNKQCNALRNHRVRFTRQSKDVT
jgi:hypothetical protein